MQQAYVEINGIRTKVTTWGRWIEESQNQNQEVVIIIPGNPGTVGFYNVFGKTLYEKLHIPVWCIGHAGHNFPETSITKFPKLQDHEELYDLKGQINHKLEFFEKYVPKNAKVHLIGHSIGSYMILEIFEHIKDRVEDAYLLFPTLEYMAETNNGKFLVNFVKPILSVIIFLTWIFTILPSFVATFLLYIYMFIANIPRKLHRQNIKDLLKPGLLRRVFFLAFEEMVYVKERNTTAIKDNIKKIKFYYGVTDGWTSNYYDKLRTDVEGVDVETTSINHAFVFNHGVDVACTVADWINTKKGVKKND